jgi:hypothetical protein
MHKIYMRLLPFAILSYVLAYIDRINVSFAGLTMRGDLDMSAAAFGFATGTFFWGYFIFEVPSNVILEKAIRAGAICYLPKPYLETELIDCIRLALAGGEDHVGPHDD